MTVLERVLVSVLGMSVLAMIAWYFNDITSRVLKAAVLLVGVFVVLWIALVVMGWI